MDQLTVHSVCHPSSWVPNIQVSFDLSLLPAIHAKEHAKTKKVVSNVLALNLVTQLYKMGAIEAARPPGAKKPSDEVHVHVINELLVHVAGRDQGGWIEIKW